MMANVLHHPIDFHPRPLPHAPSPFGFGFGLGNPLSSSSPWGTSTPGHTNPTAFQQLASSINQPSSSRVQKRRHDLEEDLDSGRYSGARDESMDRSPTPERPKRAAPKRARVAPSQEAAGKDTKENRAPGASEEGDVDVGVLLASLPTQSLLPLLSSLIKAQPSLKSTILSLIPRPTLDTAIQSLAQSAKKLRDAYPYSNSPTSVHLSTGYGLGGSTAFSQTPLQHNQQGGMRDSYILSRLRPNITDFVACCMSYLPYFTCVPLPSQPSCGPSASPLHLASTIKCLHRDKFHPSETFLFLSAVTNHLLSQPPLCISSLGPLLIPRLSEEWMAWTDKVDEVVNRQAGMFGSETVRSWERGLDNFADSKVSEVSSFMRVVRDRWVSKVGWLVGRMIQQEMEEL